MDATQFYNQYLPYAKQLQAKYGIPVNATLAILANETGWGANGMVAPFGIKGSGTAGSTNSPTWEVMNGQRVNINDNFAQYNNLGEAFDAFGQLVSTSPRYQAAIGQTDPYQFAEALRQGGYATDPSWAKKIANIAGQFPASQPQQGGAMNEMAPRAVDPRLGDPVDAWTEQALEGGLGQIGGLPMGGQWVTYQVRLYRDGNLYKSRDGVNWELVGLEADDKGITARAAQLQKQWLDEQYSAKTESTGTLIPIKDPDGNVWQFNNKTGDVTPLFAASPGTATAQWTIQTIGSQPYWVNTATKEMQPISLGWADKMDQAQKLQQGQQALTMGNLNIQKAQQDLMSPFALREQQAEEAIKAIQQQLAAGTIDYKTANERMALVRANLDAALKGTTPWQMETYKQEREDRQNENRQSIAQNILSQNLSTGANLAQGLMSGATGIFGQILPGKGAPTNFNPLMMAQGFTEQMGGGSEMTQLARSILSGALGGEAQSQMMANAPAAVASMYLPPQRRMPSTGGL